MVIYNQSYSVLFLREFLMATDVDRLPGLV
jgi:hypothetical protein